MGDWLDEGGSGSPVGVYDVMRAESTDALLRWVQAGAMVTLACTSDGGALGVTVTVDGRWRREYFRDGDELAAWIDGGDDVVMAACQARTASGGPRKRERGLRGR